MINVLHISSPITWRGGERQIANLLLALQHKKANQVLLCPANTALADFCKEKGFKHITLNKANGFSIRWAKKIKEICEENNITHIHVHDSKAQTYAVTAAALYKNEPVIIVSRRVIFPIKDKWLTQFKYTHAKIGTIICISQSVESVLLENIPAAKTTIVASCINTKKYQGSLKPATLKKEYALSEDSILIGYVAALSKEKDHGTFIETAKLILEKNEKAYFFIIGEGKERAAIERRIEKHQLQESIKLTGFIRNIDAIIPQLDLLLFTSTSEGLGSSILDFFLAKIPVVSTRCGGVEEIIIHNKTGLLSDVGNTKDLAKNALLLLSDSNLKEKITENAYEYIVENHSLEQLGEKTYDIYVDNIQAKPASADPKTQSKKLTAIIPTFNEELHIEDALKSVAFADEIIVIDSYSTDRTVALAKKNKVKVILRKFDDFSTQKNFAIAEASHDWIFILDADERLTNTLKNEIIKTLQKNTLKDAYWIYRQNYFANKRIYFSGWQNDKVMRLFNRKHAQYDGKMVHEEIKNLGSSGYLKGKMLHFSSDNEEIFRSKIVKYAKLKAQELHLENVKPNLFHYYIKPCYRFVYHYLFKFGFLDGKIGYTIACINAYGIKERYQELKRLSQKQNKLPINSGEMKFQKELNTAINILKKGGTLLYPTDTVWGIGCDASDEHAVKKVFEIKTRDESKSLIILVDSIEMLQNTIASIPSEVLSILKTSIRPTSIIYQNPIGLAKNVVAEDNTVAIRIVQNEFCQQLIKEFGKPIVSTSANSSGADTPKSFSEIKDDILNNVDYIVALLQEEINTKSSRILKVKTDGSIQVLRD